MNRSGDNQKLQELVEQMNAGCKVMIIMRGVPGSGKSYLANSLLERSNTLKDQSKYRPQDFILSSDDFFNDSAGQYNYNVELLDAAHKFNQDRVREKAAAGWSPIIVDNTNVKMWEMLPYAEAAICNGYILKVLEPNTTWRFSSKILALKNTHNVSRAKINIMIKKYEQGTASSLLQMVKNVRYTVPLPQPRQIPHLFTAFKETKEKTAIQVSQNELLPTPRNALPLQTDFKETIVNTSIKVFQNKPISPPHNVSTHLTAVTENKIAKMSQNELLHKGSTKKYEERNNLTTFALIPQTTHSAISETSIMPLQLDGNGETSNKFIQKELLLTKSKSFEEKEIHSNRFLQGKADADFSVQSCDESSLNLNHNVETSKLDISEITRNESSSLCDSHVVAANKDYSTSKLSITLNEQEQHMLKSKAPRTTASGTLLEDSIVVEESTVEPMDAEEEISTFSVAELSALSTADESKPTQVELTVEDEDSCMDDDSLTTSAIERTQTQAELTVEDENSYMGDESHTLPVNERHLFKHTMVELGRRLWKSTGQLQHYTKGCLWSPDGTCALVPVHLDGMHVVELPTDLYEVESVSMSRKVDELPSAVHVKEGGTVYDYAWYPFMNSAAPETCCWLATRQHEPIHMWDAFNGELRCTYRGYDDVDEVQSAISVIFSNDGQKVIGGFKKCIKIFDTNIPGRDCNSIAVKQAISCFGLSGSAGNETDTITTGSWNGCINHYDLRVPKLGALFTLSGHKGGITWLRYAPNGHDNWLLYSGARKDNKILQWDMRNYEQPVREFARNVNTNQRIYFDLSPQCEWLLSGDTNGLLKIWDLCDEHTDIEVALHADCCNGVNLHPTRPILATTSGQYHFVNVAKEDECDLENSNPNSSVANNESKESTKETTYVEYENSLLFLWFDKSHDAEEL